MTTNKKTLLKMYRRRSQQISEWEEDITLLEKRTREVEEEQLQIFKRLHAECPYCHGRGQIKLSEGYDSSNFWEPCPYRLTWLVGEEDAPEDWRTRMFRGEL